MSQQLHPQEEMEMKKQFHGMLVQFAMGVPKVTGSAFLMGMQEITLEEDQKAFLKSYQNVGKYFMALSVGGIVLNRLFTKSRFLPKHIVFRFPIRLGLFLLPNMPLFNYYYKLIKQNDSIIEKYDRRLSNFRKTGKLAMYDPDGRIFEKFKKPILAMRAE